MLTRYSPSQPKLHSGFQDVERDAPELPASAPSICVHVDDVAGGLDEAPQATGPASRRRKKRRGGWRPSKALRWKADVKVIYGLAAAARKSRKPLNVMATIRVPHDIGSDAAGKRAISRATAHLGQSLQRRGVRHIGLTVFEKKPGGHLHGHHLVHVPHEHDDLIARWVDGAAANVRDACPADWNVIGYVTKQRRSLPPGAESNVRHRREPGAEIVGPRWTPTKGLLACVSTQEEREQAGTGKFKKERHSKGLKRAKAGAPGAPPWALDEAGQFLLFGKASEIRLSNFWSGLVPPEVAADIDARRKALGISKGELARRAGVSRPTLSNAMAGRFGLSRQPVALLQAALAVH